MWRAKTIAAVALMSASSGLLAQELRDPTMPPQTQPQSNMDAKVNSNALQLQSIQFMGNKRSALINNERKYEGDHIRQYVIEKIDMNFVTLRDQQTKATTVLRLFSLTKDSVESSGTYL